MLRREGWGEAISNEMDFIAICAVTFSPDNLVGEEEPMMQHKYGQWR